MRLRVNGKPRSIDVRPATTPLFTSSTTPTTTVIALLSNSQMVLLLMKEQLHSSYWSIPNLRSHHLAHVHVARFPRPLSVIVLLTLHWGPGLGRIGRRLCIGGTRACLRGAACALLRPFSSSDTTRTAPRDSARRRRGSGPKTNAEARRGPRRASCRSPVAFSRNPGTGGRRACEPVRHAPSNRAGVAEADRAGTAGVKCQNGTRRRK
jgi:hypothetical protein